MRNASNGLLPSEAGGYCPLLGVSARDARLPARGDKHLDRLQRICGYLRKYPDAAIRFRTEIPDYSHLDHVTFDWAYSVYGDSAEELPSDMPIPRGRLV